MKYYKFWGILGVLLVVAACFMPWAWYSDIQEHFTGFYTRENMYGKPAKVFIFLGACSLICLLVDKVWAKRTNLFLMAVQIAYLTKTYVLFTSCYAGNCPKKEYGLFILMAGTLLMVLGALFPNVRTAGSDHD